MGTMTVLGEVSPLKLFGICKGSGTLDFTGTNLVSCKSWLPATSAGTPFSEGPAIATTVLTGFTGSITNSTGPYTITLTGALQTSFGGTFTYNLRKF